MWYVCIESPLETTLNLICRSDIEIKNKDANKPNDKRQLRPGASVKFNNENK